MLTYKCDICDCSGQIPRVFGITDNHRTDEIEEFHYCHECGEHIRSCFRAFFHGHAVAGKLKPGKPLTP